MPDVTPPQDAKFTIDLKDLLRPYHTYINDVLLLVGSYFLKRNNPEGGHYEGHEGKGGSQ